jgi:hypothetical protein
MFGDILFVLLGVYILLIFMESSLQDFLSDTLIASGEKAPDETLQLVHLVTKLTLTVG